jgi:hypothetical protein
MARLAGLLLVLLFTAAAIPAGAQDIRINPVPPHVKPQWTPVPGASGVDYAPNLSVDLFRYKSQFYLFWAGLLFKSHQPQGPWSLVKDTPPFFYQIDPKYFKTVKQPAAKPPASTPAAPAPEPSAPETTPAPERPAPPPPATTPAPAAPPPPPPETTPAPESPTPPKEPAPPEDLRQRPRL